MKKTQTLLIASMACIGGGAASFISSQIRSANANVPPTGSQLFYAGVATDATGKPLTGSPTIQVRVFDGTMGTSTLLCMDPTVAAATPLDANGHFRIKLDNCVTALANATRAFVEVQVGGDTVPPVPGSRPQIGAVPYALQASSADTAKTAPATGVTTLDGSGSMTNVQARLDALETRLGSSEATVTTLSTNVTKLTATNGTFCGATSSLMTGDLGGYVGADNICHAVAACGASSHMCTAKEMVDSARTGRLTTDDTWWTSTGMQILQGDIGGDGTPGNQSQLVDCNGWTSGNNPIVVGSTFNRSGTTIGPSQQTCPTPARVACCRFQ